MKVSGVIFALEQYDVTTVQQITPLLNLSDPTFGRMIPRMFWSCETARQLSTVTCRRGEMRVMRAKASGDGCVTLCS